MKITRIETVRVNLPPREYSVKPRRDSWNKSAEVANPMSRFPHVKRRRALWTNTGWGARFRQSHAGRRHLGAGLNHSRKTSRHHHRRPSRAATAGSRRLRHRAPRRHDVSPDQILWIDGLGILRHQRHRSGTLGCQRQGAWLARLQFDRRKAKGPALIAIPRATISTGIKKWASQPISWLAPMDLPTVWTA